MSVANPFLKLKVRLYTPASEAFKAELPLSLCNPKTWIISKLRSRLRGFERQNTAVIWDDEGTWTKPLVGIKCERINKSILCLSDWWPAETGERWGQCGPFHWCTIKKNKWKKTNPHSSSLDNELEPSQTQGPKRESTPTSRSLLTPLIQWRQRMKAWLSSATCPKSTSSGLAKETKPHAKQIAKQKKRKSWLLPNTFDAKSGAYHEVDKTN